jgi:hypothetical protein
MSQLPRWASDANFPAGSKPWNGEPTRVEPANTIKARGFAPGAKPPAGWFNHLFGILLDESNDQDTRLAALEVLTLQGAFDNSVLASNNPTIKLKASGAGVDFTVQDSAGRALLTVDGDAGSGHPSVAVGGTGWDEGLWVRGGATFALENATSRRVILRPSSATTANYDITFPPGEPPTKAVMRRGAGSTSASDWVAMDWGDTDGRGSGWDVSGASASYGTVVFTRGTWHRIGQVVSFAMKGTLTTDSGGVSDFVVPLPMGIAALGPGGLIATMMAQSDWNSMAQQWEIDDYNQYINCQVHNGSGAISTQQPWSVTGQFQLP